MLSPSSQEAVLEDHSASSPKLEALGCGPHPVQATPTGAHRFPSELSFGSFLLLSPPLPGGLLPYWICPCSPILSHPS